MSTTERKPRSGRLPRGKDDDKDERKRPQRELTGPEREAAARVTAADEAAKKLSSEVKELGDKIFQKRSAYFELNKQQSAEKDAITALREEISSVAARKKLLCESIMDDIERARGAKTRASKEVTELRKLLPGGQSHTDFDFYVNDEKMDPYKAAILVVQEAIKEKEFYHQTQTLDKRQEQNVMASIKGLKALLTKIRDMEAHRSDESKEDAKAKEGIPADPQERAKLVRECIAKYNSLALSMVPHFQKLQEISKKQTALLAEIRQLMDKREEVMKKGKEIVESRYKALHDGDVARAKALAAAYAKKVAAAKKLSAEIKQKNAEMKAEREKREKEAENDLPYEKELGIIERLVSLLRRMELPAQTEKKDGAAQDGKAPKKGEEPEEDTEGLVIISKPQAVVVGKKNKRRNMSEQRGVDVAGKKVEKKKKGPAPTDRLPLGIPEFRDFEAVSVVLPETYADVRQAIEQLTAKKKEFERLRNLAAQERAKAIAESKKEALKQAEMSAKEAKKGKAEEEPKEEEKETPKEEEEAKEAKEDTEDAEKQE